VLGAVPAVGIDGLDGREARSRGGERHKREMSSIDDIVAMYFVSKSFKR
jgi:hypothetical protein